ncbi:MAG TPA: molybdenum cofactor biosynthesis protein B, partial [Patescibacteria group bacterium]|nr:molybdenum cofactor biosynthesis protein B [Patescibacteria group bacterium]
HGHKSLRVGVLTASDSRSAETDESGKLIRGLLSAAGHHVEYYEVLADDPALIRNAVMDRLQNLDAIIVNGGTGISARDSTIEAIRVLLDKELEGFGELFRYLSYEQIGSAAFLSRAMAGIAAGKIVVSLPGSPDACRLAMEKLLIPELGHMAHLLKL